MTDRELMQMALNVFDWLESRTIYQDGAIKELYKALRDRLAQPEREWVGLTDEEIDGWNIVGHESLREFVRAIEAKLKEKNT